MLALGLALGAALAWGTADFLGGLTTRGLGVLTVLLVSQAFGAALLAVVIAATGQPVPDTRRLVFGLLAGVALAIALGALYQGMAIGAMSVVSPISATGAIIPVAYGLAQGERPSAVQSAGVAAALVGAVLVSRQPAAARLGARLATGVTLAVLAALGFGFFFIATDVAAEGGALWATLAQRLGLVATVVVVLLAVRPRLGLTATPLPALLGIGILDVTATTLYAAATTHGLTSLVAVVSSLYPVTTVVLAYALLHERLARSQQLGAATALGGVALIGGG